MNRILSFYCCSLIWNTLHIRATRFCEIWNSHGSHYGEYCLLVCDAV
jgi:hypothetical protein